MTREKLVDEELSGDLKIEVELSEKGKVRMRIAGRCLDQIHAGLREIRIVLSDHGARDFAKDIIRLLDSR